MSTVEERSVEEQVSFADFDEIEKFAKQVEEYQNGTLDPEEFRRIRLWMGVYGQRGLTDIHMIRVKVPQGRVLPHHLDAFATLAERYSRGFGHVTTRQNLQFHFVDLVNVPDALRLLARAGVTTREACGDTVRNVTACHLAGSCPLEVLDVRKSGEELTRHFLRNPLSQDLPRKFKVALSGCPADCAQTAIHDIGVLAIERETKDGTIEAGYRILVGGGLGSDPHEAKTLEPFTHPDDLLVTSEAVLRVYDRLFDVYADRTKRARSRLKILVERMGIEAFRDAVFKERTKIAGSAAGVDKGSIETQRKGFSNETRVVSSEGAGSLFALGSDDLEEWRKINVVEQKQPGLFAAYVSLPLGDITAEQLRALANFLRPANGELVCTNRQNIVIPNLDSVGVEALWNLLNQVGLAGAMNDRAANVVACPGAETCNLALTTSRGVAGAIADALSAAGLADVPGVRINVSGCQNSCGQHHTSDIGLMGFARRDDHGNEAPAYRVLVGARINDGGVRFGTYVVKLPAKRAPEAIVRLVSSYVSQRNDQENFADWIDRVGEEKLKSDLADLDYLPSRDEAPEFFEDWGLTERFKVILGRGECAS
ncbi:MAG: nitrite/sulfite reductase [Actinomycetota bacterium]